MAIPAEGTAYHGGLYARVHDAVEERLSRPSMMSFKPEWRDYFVDQLADFRAGRPVAVMPFELPAGVLFKSGLRLGAGRCQAILLHPDDRMAVVDSDRSDVGPILFWDDL